MSMPDILTAIPDPIYILTDYRPFPEAKWSDTGHYLVLVINIDRQHTASGRRKENIYFFKELKSLWLILKIYAVYCTVKLLFNNESIPHAKDKSTCKVCKW